MVGCHWVRRPRQVSGQLAVQAPRAPFGTCQVGSDWLAGDFESVAHARQQSVELLVAEVDLVGEELADARLVYATEPRQL